MRFHALGKLTDDQRAVARGIVITTGGELVDDILLSPFVLDERGRTREAGFVDEVTEIAQCPPVIVLRSVVDGCGKGGRRKCGGRHGKDVWMFHQNATYYAHVGQGVWRRRQRRR